LIGRRSLPAAFAAWNRQWNAPYGSRWGRRIRKRAPRVTDRFPRLLGPFGFQPNNSTRIWEYPWAFHAVPIAPGQRVVDLGGGLAGFQFALSHAGAVVTNVDPGEDLAGRFGVARPRTIERLNRAFGTTVDLYPGDLRDARLTDGTIDTVYSISTIEHVPPDDLASLAGEIARVLVPGGHFVATVDLFLDLEPFSDRERNAWGTNVDLHSLVEATGLTLAVGERAELYGFEEFDTRGVLAELSSYLYGGNYPALAQCFVLEKPTRQ
jgi:SAM-dependent methyltransferase